MVAVTSEATTAVTIGTATAAITEATAGIATGVNVGTTGEAITAGRRAIGHPRENTVRGFQIDQPAISPRRDGKSAYQAQDSQLFKICLCKKLLGPVSV